MSTISSINIGSASYLAPIAVDNSSTSASSFSQTLAVAQAPQSWLTTAEASHASRPNVKEFMDRSGAEFLDASELIYGVIGSNTDVRDWSVIMASDDPITAARQATAQMYGRTEITPRTDATYMSADDMVAKEGNFAVRLLKDEDNKVLDQGLKLIDAQGLLLRDAGSNPESIARNAWLFGFDTAPLAKLAQAAQTVSEDLSKAVEQASVISQATPTPASPAQSTGTSVSVYNTSQQDMASSAAPMSMKPAEPAVAAQKDDQATSPSLATVVQETTASALKYMDSSSYLSSFFKA